MEKSNDITWNVGIPITDAEREKIRAAIRSDGLKIGGLLRRLLLEWADAKEEA